MTTYIDCKTYLIQFLADALGAIILRWLLFFYKIQFRKVDAWGGQNYF